MNARGFIFAVIGLLVAGCGARKPDVEQLYTIPGSTEHVVTVGEGESVAQMVGDLVAADPALLAQVGDTLIRRRRDIVSAAMVNNGGDSVNLMVVQYIETGNAGTSIVLVHLERERDKPWTWMMMEPPIPEEQYLKRFHLPEPSPAQLAVDRLALDYIRHNSDIAAMVGTLISIDALQLWQKTDFEGIWKPEGADPGVFAYIKGMTPFLLRSYQVEGSVSCRIATLAFECDEDGSWALNKEGPTLNECNLPYPTPKLIRLFPSE